MIVVGDQIKGLISQAATGLLGAMVASLVGSTLPEPFRTLVLLAAVVWFLVIYWMWQKPSKKDVLESVKYLDALHDHAPKLIDDSEYYRRVNRLLVLDGLSSRQLVQQRSRAEASTKKGQVCKKDRSSLVKTLMLRLGVVASLLLPIAYGVVWALCKAGTLSGGIAVALRSYIVLAVIALVVLVADFCAVRRLPSPSIYDYLTFVSVDVMLWGLGYLIVFWAHESIPLRPLLLSLALSFYGLLVLGYLPYRHSIDEGVRSRIASLMLIVWVSFYSVALAGYRYLVVGSFDFTTIQALFMVGLVTLSGCMFLWFYSLQNDLVLDVIIGTCGDEASRGPLLDRVGTLVGEARRFRNSIMALLPGTALFAAVLGVLTAISV